MRILFYNNVPLYLRNMLPDSRTAFQEGWNELSNGNLLEAAEGAGYNLLVTLDKGFESQQSLRNRKISIAILKPIDQSRESALNVAKKLAAKLTEIDAGSLVVVDQNSNSSDSG